MNSGQMQNTVLRLCGRGGQHGWG